MSRTLIIAEAGVNHNGSIELAKQLIDAAAEANADYVKFQTFRAERIVSRSAKMAKYQKENTTNEANDFQFDMLKKLELDVQSHRILIEYAKSKDIRFLSTAFDLESIDLLDKLNIPFFKIPSGEITNLPYLEKIANKKRPVVLSTGMSNLDEIEDALNVLYSSGLEKRDITVLHCNTQYPTPMQDVNLSAMKTIKERFNVKVGYSDHTLGIEIPIAAIALGAEIIEKHFTLDKGMCGPDHKASLSPEELKLMVQCIRNIEIAIGNGIKELSESEKENIYNVRKSIVAKTRIKKGDLFSIDNIDVKRPGIGISPMKWHYVIGRISPRDFEPDQVIEL